MSLEAKIEALTSAVLALTVQLQGTSATPLPAVDAALLKRAEVVEAKKPAPILETAPANSTASGEPSASTVAVSYDDVKGKILQISAISRDNAVALLQRYGAKSGKDLTEAQYVAFYEDALRVLSGDFDPTKGSDDDIPF